MNYEILFYIQRFRKETCMKKKIFAFTLAEVLITLAIIGVVAAITIPNVIKNYQKHVYATRLKKDYNIITNSLNKAMADDGVDDFFNTEFGKAITENSQDDIETNMNKYFKNFVMLNDSDGYNYSSKAFANRPDYRSNVNINWCSGNVCFDLPDATFYIKRSGGNLLVYVDTNGFKQKPNQAGKDFFSFYLDKNLKPVGSFGFYHGTDHNHNICHSHAYERGCFFNVMNNGWEIKYY